MGDILFLAHRIPFPPDRGDKIRAHHLLKHLADLAPVHVGCFWENEKDRAAEAELAAVSQSHCLARRAKPLSIAGVEAVVAGKPVSLTAFHDRSLEKWIEQTVSERDISTIFVFSGQMGQYIPDSFVGQVIVDLCDVDSVKFEDYAKAGERIWLNRREGRLLRHEEERLAHRADTTILISENEKSVLQTRLSNAAGARIMAIGNGIDAAFFRPGVSEPHAEMEEREGPHFVFTGQMDYRPNEAAALWTIEHFMPAIRRRFPDAEYHVVGRNPTAALLAKADVPGVTVWGEVPDVRPFLAAADMALVPLTIARGVQNKVLEAMAMGLPVMLTEQAATGISALDARDWTIVPADAEAMVDRFASLWVEKAKLAQMGQDARQFVLENHSWAAMLEPLGAMLAAAKDQRNAA